MKLSPKQDFARRYKALAHEQVVLLARIAELKVSPTLQDAVDIGSASTDSARRLARIGNQAVALVDDAADMRLEFAKPLRQFMLDHGVKRPAQMPNLTKTIMVLQSCLAVEAVGTAVLLVSDGTMGLVAGLLTGTVFSGVNIALGTAIGYFGLRNAIYRKEVPEQKSGEHIKRWAYAAASALGFGIMGVMHCAAARVRVVGDHAGIWNFETASLLDTVSDYNALTLVAVGVLSSGIAAYEGFCRVSDPIIGFSEITKDTQLRISDALNKAYDAGAEQLEVARDSAVHPLEGTYEADTQAYDDYRAEIQALREDVGHFNCDVKLVVSEFKTLQTSENKRRQYLEGTGREAVPINFDLAALRQLRIDEAVIPDGDIAPCDPTKSIARLEEAFEEASGKLRAAHTAASNFITLPFSDGRREKAS